MSIGLENDQPRVTYKYKVPSTRLSWKKPLRVTGLNPQPKKSTVELVEQLQRIIDAKSEKELYDSGKEAIAWLDQSESNHRDLYLKGLARVTKKLSLDSSNTSANVVAALEVLSRYNLNVVADILLIELGKPQSEEHLYLVGLCHEVCSAAISSKVVDALATKIIDLLCALLKETQLESWQSHLVVECSRVIATLSPKRFFVAMGDELPNVGEMEMTAVLQAFLSSVRKIKDELDIRTWIATADKIWKKYSENPALPNSEGVLAYLLSFYLLAGQEVEKVLERSKALKSETEVLYLLGMENPAFSDRDQQFAFYRHVATRLILENQVTALGRFFVNPLRTSGIKPSDLFVTAK